MATFETIAASPCDKSDENRSPDGDFALPNPVKLSLSNETGRGPFPVTRLYELLAQNGGLTHEEQIAALFPNLPKGKYNYNTAWNNTLFARQALTKQLAEGQTGLAVGDVEDETGNSKSVILRNGHFHEENNLTASSPLEYPEKIGREGTAKRILADLLFPKGLKKGQFSSKICVKTL